MVEKIDRENCLCDVSGGKITKGKFMYHYEGLDGKTYKTLFLRTALKNDKDTTFKVDEFNTDRIVNIAYYNPGINNGNLAMIYEI